MRKQPTIASAAFVGAMGLLAVCGASFHALTPGLIDHVGTDGVAAFCADRAGSGADAGVWIFGLVLFVFPAAARAFRHRAAFHWLEALLLGAVVLLIKAVSLDDSCGDLWATLEAHALWGSALMLGTGPAIMRLSWLVAVK